MNSSESNLFTIRLNTPILNNTSINNIDDNVFHNLYNDPPYELLPSGFEIHIDSITSIITINYGNINFVNNPTVNINFIGNTTPYVITNMNIDKNNYLITFQIFNNGILLSLSNLNTFNSALSINICGAVYNGQSFNISNKGWYQNINDDSSIYSYSNINIGTALSSAKLNLKGTLSYQYGDLLCSTMTENILRENVLNIINIDSTKNIALTAGLKGQIIEIFISAVVGSNSLTLTGDIAQSILFYILKSGSNTSVTLDTKGQSLTMIYDDSLTTWFVIKSKLS